MKKILVALCAVALIGLTGCKKDNVAPEEPSAESGSGQSDPERPPQSGTWADIPGVYSPAAKIVTVNEDGTLSETWRWEDDLLKVVKSDDGSEKVRFTHDERGRVKTMTINGEGRISGTVNVSYNGDQISRMSLMNGSSEVFGATLTYSGGKVTKGLLNVSDMMVFEMFNAMLARYLGGEGDSLDIVTGIDEVGGDINFIWDGDNVNMVNIGVSARLKTTLGKIVEMIPDMSIFGDYGPVIQGLAAIYPNREVYIKVSMRDTAEYTYNTSYVNPLRRYLGGAFTIDDNMPRFEVATLSRNPQAHEYHHGSATAEISVQLYGPTAVTIWEQSMPLPSSDRSYNYSTTRSDGYPETVDNGISIKTYIYQDSEQ
ncbi:MAG: hypothetical protein K6F72_06795 [Bacteroidales bacterium]|nr:hypothetical protein [Bacteroidales bacterium]